MSELTNLLNQYGSQMSTPMSLGAPQNQNTMNDTLTKLTDWIKNNMMIVVIVAVVLFMFGGRKKIARYGRSARNRFSTYRSNRRMRRGR